MLLCQQELSISGPAGFHLATDSYVFRNMHVEYSAGCLLCVLSMKYVNVLYKQTNWYANNPSFFCLFAFFIFDIWCLLVFLNS